MFGMNLFAQNQNTLKGLEEFHTFCGKYLSFNEENSILKLESNDSIYSFLISAYMFDSEEYSNIKSNVVKWNNCKESIYLNLLYFVNIYYHKSTQSIKQQRIGRSISECKAEDMSPRAFDFELNNEISTLKCKLSRVEIGDYLHISVITESNKKRSFWVYYDIDQEKLDMLYEKSDMELDDDVVIKYCKTVGYIEERGSPIIMDTCVEIDFLELR
jgi:hypothetical protein